MTYKPWEKTYEEEILWDILTQLKILVLHQQKATDEEYTEEDVE